MSNAPLGPLPDAVLVLDAHCRVVDGNDVVWELTGVSRDAAVGRPLCEVLAPTARDGTPMLSDGWHPSSRLRSVRRIPEQEVELRVPQGRAVKVLVTGRYQRADDGAVSGAVLSLRPAGRRRDLGVQGVAIISTVSHELRSPLTSVKGYTSLLLNRWDRLKDDQKRLMLEQVNHDADRVTRLITELLDISRLQAGRLVLRRQLVDLAGLAASVVEKLTLEYPDLDVAVDFPDDFPKVMADPDKVTQVLSNLVENAAKYGSPVGMRVSGELDGTEVAVAVADRGEGIAPAVLGHLFDMFFRAPDTKPTGSGLGLWISRGLVEAHGGRLTATSEVGVGSTFRFTLPAAVPAELGQ